jgi:hypothetical protein
MDTNLISDTGGLSAEELELLAYMLEEEGVEIAARQTIFPRQQQDNLPLSFAQSRLWFLDQLDPGMIAYNLPYAMHIKGRLDVAALRQSLNAVVERHEVLRTTFPSVAGQPIQSIAAALALDVPLLDLRSLPEPERKAQIYQLATREAQHTFDLARGPLLTAKLLHPAEEEYVLLLTIHHIVFDGWSVGVFLQEVIALYDAFSSGQPSPLPALPIQYADFALRAAHPGAADRPAAPAAPDPPRCALLAPAPPGAGRDAYRLQPARRRHAVYDPAGSLQRSALPLLRPA